jgi:hypothetical protein
MFWVLLGFRNPLPINVLRRFRNTGKKSRATVNFAGRGKFRNGVNPYGGCFPDARLNSAGIIFRALRNNCCIAI